jgi:hypothetical protein
VGVPTPLFETGSNVGFAYIWLFPTQNLFEVARVLDLGYFALAMHYNSLQQSKINLNIGSTHVWSSISSRLRVYYKSASRYFLRIYLKIADFENVECDYQEVDNDT